MRLTFFTSSGRPHKGQRSLYIRSRREKQDLTPDAHQADQLGKVRILLADDHRNFLEIVRNLLGGTWEVVGSLPNGRSLFEAAMVLKPDVIVTDISMPVLNGIEAANELHQAGCTSKIIFLTVHADPDFLTSCLAAGALGYVIKSRTFTDLIPAIHEALAGRIFISPSFTER